MSPLAQEEQAAMAAQEALPEVWQGVLTGRSGVAAWFGEHLASAGFGMAVPGLPLARLPWAAHRQSGAASQVLSAESVARQGPWPFFHPFLARKWQDGRAFPGAQDRCHEVLWPQRASLQWSLLWLRDEVFPPVRPDSALEIAALRMGRQADLLEGHSSPL